MKRDLRGEMKGLVRKYVDSRRSLYLPVGILNPDLLYLPVGIQTLFTFIPTPHEIDTIPLMRHALESGMTVAAPRIRGTGLAFHTIDSTDGPFVKGPHNLQEPFHDAPCLFPADAGSPGPAFPLVVLVPGLAFTRDGRRLGRGGGYYDRFISALLAAFPERRHQITLAGTAWSFQIVDSLPVEPHDRSVDCLYTEKGCILCV